MIETLEAYDPAALGRFDAVIDVRSPAEFALDHVPGAVNLPVLDDEERARIGTIYVQDSRLKARRLGAALVARNIARHLEGPLRRQSRRLRAARLLLARRPALGRHGQRARAGRLARRPCWRAATRPIGGWVTGALYRRRADIPRHRSSTATPARPRPSPPAPEAPRGPDSGPGGPGRAPRLALRRPAGPAPAEPEGVRDQARLALDGIDPTAPDCGRGRVRARSARSTAPPTLWKAMLAAPRIELAAPAPARARYLVSAYGDIASDPEALEQRSSACRVTSAARAWRPGATGPQSGVRGPGPGPHRGPLRSGLCAIPAAGGAPAPGNHRPGDAR